MRPVWGLPLLFALGKAGDIVKRQDNTSSSDAVASESQDVASTTTEDVASTTEAASTTQDTNSDTTVTVTTTVDGGDGSTATSTTTVASTRTTTIAVTSTVFATTTVTSSDEKTATSTVYETTTVTPNNQRRAIQVAARTIPAVEAILTQDAPEPMVTPADEPDLEMLKPRAHHAKRDTITVTKTVTGSKGADTTVVATVTRTAVSTATSRTTVTDTVTETEQANASTTVTVTSTLTVTSADVTTGVSEATSTTTETSSGGGGSSSGLSTGAKAGIGAGVGVVGLAVIGGIIFFCWRKRRNSSKYDPDDNAFGASEVPVGAAAAGAAGSAPGPRTPDMSHSPSNASRLTPGVAAAAAVPKPYQAPEGYRGTAMGDGRAGYAKPETYGAAYTRASGINKSPGPLSPSPVSPGTAYSGPTEHSNILQPAPDVLPEHPLAAEMDSSSYAQPQELGAHNDAAATRWANPNASEIDSQPAVNQSHGPVYEMPSENYR